jgi:hypothetical protein
MLKTPQLRHQNAMIDANVFWWLFIIIQSRVWKTLFIFRFVSQIFPFRSVILNFFRFVSFFKQSGSMDECVAKLLVDDSYFFPLFASFTKFSSSPISYNWWLFFTRKLWLAGKQCQIWLISSDFLRIKFTNFSLRHHVEWDFEMDWRFLKYSLGIGQHWLVIYAFWPFEFL